ncbi:conserved hypothetical protein [Paenibacillus curdlanolyticus YK9]|uniref:PDGLE domain-containing protein n=1 Tax=Paenibacillus curdlanolyticus YK9 TaxID=717606 RepID=E0I923_9BACL|nr:PDGLE domain-containing protein [Paenibacillus curdlanolyticus]EFM10907.1 conserved hypothetical protein [Paenibacillus curdlanolyticus YK9]
MSELRVTGHKRRWIVMGIITVAVAGLLSPWASSSPDGLERVAEDHGFLHQADAVNRLALVPDYEVAGIPWSAVRIGLAGVLGIAIMAAVLWGLTRSLARGGGDRHESGSTEVDGVQR